MGEYLGLVTILGVACIGRMAVMALFERPNVFIGWTCAALTGMAAFLACLVLFPPLVLDPMMVAAQLPLFGAAVGAVVEAAAQFVGWAVGRTPWRLAGRRVLVMAIVGAMAFGGLNAYQRWVAN